MGRDRAVEKARADSGHRCAIPRDLKTRTVLFKQGRSVAFGVRPAKPLLTQAPCGSEHSPSVRLDRNALDASRTRSFSPTRVPKPRPGRLLAGQCQARGEPRALDLSGLQTWLLPGL